MGGHITKGGHTCNCFCCVEKCCLFFRTTRHMRSKPNTWISERVNEVGKSCDAVTDLLRGTLGHFNDSGDDFFQLRMREGHLLFVVFHGAGCIRMQVVTDCWQAGLIEFVDGFVDFVSSLVAFLLTWGVVPRWKGKYQYWNTVIIRISASLE